MKITKICAGGFLAGMAIFASASEQGEPKGVTPVTTPEDAVQEKMAIPDWISASGLIEATAFFESADTDTSDILLSTVEIGLEAKPHEGLAGRLLFLWEEDESDGIEIDEGVVEYGGTEELPVVLSAGRMYVPFGSYESRMTSDPLTLELGESRQSAVAFRYGDKQALQISAALFSGELDAADTIENAAVSFAITPAEWIKVGVSAITDIGEGGMADAINEATANGDKYDKAAGLGAFAIATHGRFSLSAEYIAAVESMRLAGQETSSFQPSAWFLELACDIDNQWAVAARYEGSSEFLPEEMPETQFGLTLSFAATEFATVSLEQLYGKFDGDNSDRHITTATLAVSF